MSESSSSRIALRALVVALIGYGVCSYYIANADNDFVFNFIPYLFISLLGIVVFLRILFIDKKRYNQEKNKAELVPTILGIAIIIYFTCTVYWLHQRDNSPVRLSCASRYIDFNGIFIDFREDNTYKITDWTAFGSDYYRGIYSIKDSIITLDTSNGIKKILVGNRLMIRTDKNADGNYQKFIYQIDTQGKVIIDADEFVVKQVSK